MVIFLNFEFLSNYYPRGELKNMYCFFFLKQKWKKWQYQYQCQSFLLYYRKNIFSTIAFLKSKRVSLCHKRKLPSLIKFRKKTQQKLSTEQNNTHESSMQCQVCKKMKTPLLTSNTGTWCDKVNRFTPASWTPLPTGPWTLTHLRPCFHMSVPLREGQTMH